MLFWSYNTYDVTTLKLPRILAGDVTDKQISY